MARTTGYRIEFTRPMDSDTSRDSGVRVLSVLFFGTLIVATPTLLIGFWGSLLGYTTTGLLLGFLIGGITLAYIAPRRMFVYNPEWAGYVTQNVWGGTMVPYGPGLHASHWWEQRNADGNYSLEVEKQSFELPIATKTSKVIINGEYEYAIDLPLIERAIGISKSIVQGGIVAFIKNVLTDECDTKNAEVVLEEIEPLGTMLSDHFMDDGDPVRKNYGYKTVSVVITRISLPENVQETRDAVAEADSLFEVVAKLYGRTKEELKELIRTGDITEAQYQKMLTRAMAVSGNKTNVDVKVIEGLEGSPGGRRGKSSPNPAAVAGAVLSAFQEGGRK